MGIIKRIAGWLKTRWESYIELQIGINRLERKIKHMKREEGAK